MKYTTIQGLVETSEDAKAGSNGSWQAFTNWTRDDHQERSVYHYRTLMLSYRTEADGYTWDGDVDTVHTSRGWGSMSDHQGMNALLGGAGIPAIFDKESDSGIVWLPRKRHYAYR